MDIYFDTCFLNRLTDDPSQPRIRAEALATEAILAEVDRGLLRWTSSSVLRLELAANPDPVKRAEALALLVHAHRFLELTPAAETHALRLQTQGIAAFDALHLALCEVAGIEVLLTVDDRFIRRSAHVTKVEVLNPIDWWARRGIWLRNPSLQK